MSATDYKKYNLLLAKRAAFLQRVEYFVRERPKWTPAEGALLVSGVIPFPRGCEEIPEPGGQARQLDDLNLPATHDQLRGARRVLHGYLDHVKDGDRSGRNAVLPRNFLTWCDESGQVQWSMPKLPEFLRHLYFPGYDKHPFTLSVRDELASLIAEDEARQKGLDHRELDITWAILDGLDVRLDAHPFKVSVEAELASLASTVARAGAGRIHKTSGPGKRPGLHTEIVLAQEEARQKGLSYNDPDVIWGILDRMINDPGAKSTRLRGIDRDGIHYASPDGRKTYTYKSLKKYLSTK